MSFKTVPKAASPLLAQLTKPMSRDPLVCTKEIAENIRQAVGTRLDARELNVVEKVRQGIAAGTIAVEDPAVTKVLDDLLEATPRSRLEAGMEGAGRSTLAPPFWMGVWLTGMLAVESNWMGCRLDSGLLGMVVGFDACALAYGVKAALSD